MLPDPALTLTIPSLHDGTTLDCRLYHPASLAAGNPRAPPWRRHAAIVAHPYAPMGGCYDDAVVEIVAQQLLREGFLVGTFNFRGAGHSAGKTSWTAKPEREDYASFVGFMVHYVHNLDPFRDALDDRDASDDTEADSEARHPVLLMCGYSYGAMVTTQLGPLEALLRPFDSPDVYSDAAEIRLRAEHLAEQQNLMLGDVRAAALEQLRHSRQHQLGSPTSTLSSASPRSRSGMRVGGDEGNLRRSHESPGRGSFSADAEDKLKKGVHGFFGRRRTGRDASSGARWHSVSAHAKPKSVNGSGSPPKNRGASASPPASSEEPCKTSSETNLAPPADLVAPRPAYLLVSPLQGLVTHLATMSLVPSLFGGRGHRHEHDKQWREAGAGADEAKLVRNPTLAVYGDRDVFVSAGKLRAWSGRLAGAQESMFRGLEVPTAGHFWAEEGVLGAMRDAAGRFAGALLRG
ncbi:hypothetical protein HIM_05214 [Hirsutella minnesotensis 3608]|uniref:AB hydrolase-1 domain-containing protein n=1 Tax=Hirsutella minnesotensis 3608 TaxID=1043627 RepID=A0A0F7ZUQ8_9HYPO|nr:hypothetical protein HIM_05214 [Hirsutella minnesotensis 3608]